MQGRCARPDTRVGITRVGGLVHAQTMLCPGLLGIKLHCLLQIWMIRTSNVALVPV